MKKTWIVALVLILIVALWVTPRLLGYIWAHDSSAKLIYDSKISQHIQLFHGYEGRKLILIDEPLLYSTAFVYFPSKISPLQQKMDARWVACPRSDVRPLKIMAFSLRDFKGTDLVEPICRMYASGLASVSSTPTTNTIDFMYQGKPIHVSWLGYTEPPR